MGMTIERGEEGEENVSEMELAVGIGSVDVITQKTLRIPCA